MASIERTASVIVSAGAWTGFTVANLATRDSVNATTNSTTYVNGVLRGFDFQIPTGAVITGVRINVVFGSSAGNATAYLRGRLSKNAGTSWSAYGTELSTSSSSGNDVYIGSETELWGLSPTVSELNDTANFYVQIDGYTTSNKRQNRLDYVGVEVFYTLSQNLTKDLTDTVTTSDQRTSTSEIERTLSDTVTISDESARVRGILRMLEDNVIISDEYDFTAPLEKVLSDSVTVSNEVAEQMQYVRELEDSVWASDNISGLGVLVYYSRAKIGGVYVYGVLKIPDNGNWLKGTIKDKE